MGSENNSRFNSSSGDSPGYLVAISPSPYSRYIIRWTSQSAEKRNVPWIAVYIQTDRKLSEDENGQLKKNIKMVNELGAEVIVSMDDDAANGILRVARQHNIAHIVIGKPLGYRHSLFSREKNIVDKLIRSSGETDIFVISEQGFKLKRQRNLSEKISNFARESLNEFLFVTLWLAILIGINLYLFAYISYLSVGFILLAAVSVISSIYRRGPVLYFAALSAVLWNFLFLQPRFTFYIDHLEDLFMFLMYFITAYVTGNLTTRLRVKDEFLRKREKHLEELYRMGKILNESNNLEELIQRSMQLLKNIFSLKIAVILHNEENNLSPSVHEGSDFSLDDIEFEIASWCYVNGKPAGRNSDFFESSSYSYIPMLTQTKPVGVVAIDNREKGGFSIEQESLFISLISQITIAVERSEFNKSWQRMKLAEESEKIYQILLNSVSHELKTPITTISTAANGLNDAVLGEKAEVRKIFTDDIIDASDRLNRIVDNLLGTIKIETDRKTLNLEWYDVSELASAVQKKTERLMGRHIFRVEIPQTLPIIKFDFMLMEHLVSNLLYNAILYTPPGSTIILRIESDSQNILISVNDNGPGIPETEREKIFKKFYRPKGSKTGGIGLGLSICREVAEIHNGTISVTGNETGGASFIVSLPLQRSEIQGDL